MPAGWKKRRKLLESLVRHHPGSAALQAKRIGQWLKANDLTRAYAALRDGRGLAREQCLAIAPAWQGDRHD